MSNKEGVDQNQESAKWDAIYFAREAIYQKQRDQVLQSIQQTQDPVKFIGQFAADLVSALVQDGRSKGVKFNRQVVIGIFKEILRDIFQLANAAGALSISSEKEAKKMINSAMLHATEAYARISKSNMGAQQADPQPEQPAAAQPRGLLGGVRR